MRLIFALALAGLPLSVAGAVPLPAAPAKTGSVVLAGKGLVLRGVLVRFGTARALTMQRAVAVLGAATKVAVYPECGGDHPIAYATFKGGVELSFVNGKFVGWTLEYNGDKRIRTANGIGLGATVRTLQRLFADVFIDPGNEEGGGIGPGFQSDTWGNGFLDGTKATSKVISMYAGETCIVE